MKEKVYYPELDVIKGIAILLIILGHSLCEFPVNIDEQLQSVIPYVDGFSLAIFFVASGFLYSTKDSWSVFLKKKSLRLLLPYVTFCLLTIILRFAFAPFTHSGAPSISDALLRLLTGGYYWFLYALFLIMVICRLIKKNAALLAVAIICLAFSVIDIKAAGVIKRCINFIPFFILGYFVKIYYKDVLKYISNNSGNIFLVILPVLYVIVVSVFAQLQGVSFVIEGIVGSLFVWILSIKLTKAEPCRKILSFFGRYSLQFYLNHLLIMLPCYYIASFLPFSNAILLWLLIFVMAVAISWVMLLVEKRLKKIHFLFGL